MDAFFHELQDEHRIIRTAIHPARWSSFVTTYTLNWNYVDFSPSNLNQVPTTPGIYCFHIGHLFPELPRLGYVLYVGITTRTLRTRYREYLREKDDPDGRVPVRKFLRVFDGELSFAYASVNVDTIDLRELERILGGAVMPPYSQKDLPTRLKQRRSAWQ